MKKDVKKLKKSLSELAFEIIVMMGLVFLLIALLREVF